MSKRTLGLIVAAVGAAALIIAAAADVIGLSGEASEGFGNRQIIGTVVGAVVLAAGLAYAFLAGRRD